MPAVQATGGEGMRSRGGRENGGDLATDLRCEAGCRGRGGGFGSGGCWITKTRSVGEEHI